MPAGALLLSYPHVLLSQKGERRQDASHDLLSSGRAADGHEASGVRRVGFDDGNERHPRGRQPLRDGSECAFVGGSQADRVGAAFESTGATFAGRVDDVRCLQASWQVRPHDHIVEKPLGLLGDRIERDCTIARSSWLGG
jgi:hypothetical protein